MKVHVSRSAYWGLALVTLIGFVHSGTALKCWQCNSDMSPECGDPMNNTDHHKVFHTKDCEDTVSSYPYSQEKKVCRKVVQRAHGQRIVIRSCSVMTPDEMDNSDGKCSHSTTASHITVESCNICSTDLCNGASSVSGLSLLATSVIALLSCYFNFMK